MSDSDIPPAVWYVLICVAAGAVAWVFYLIGHTMGFRDGDDFDFGDNE